MTKVERNSVLWVGALDPLIEQSIKDAGFETHLLANVDEWTKHVRDALALVVRSDEARPRFVQHCVDHLDELIDHGVLVIVTGDEREIQIASSRLGMRLSDVCLKLLSANTILTLLSRAPRIPAALPDLVIDGLQDELDGERLLFQRAFFGCERVEVQDVGGGTTGRTWMVHAEFPGEAGAAQRPLPFFAKIAERGKIQTEIRTYGRSVDHFVPFSLRPHLDLERCVIGSKKGILVTRFVEDSEPLIDVVRRGMGGPVIASLFERTLRGWHHQATLRDDSFHVLKGGFVKETLLLSKRSASVSLKRSPAELIELVANGGSAYFGPTHGDLHVGNVRVCRHDAVLIDFEKVSDAPQAIDPACLEVSIAFGALPGDKNDSWQGVIGELYRCDEVFRPQRVTQRGNWAWLQTAVRQIRRLGLATAEERVEYGWALVGALLRHARFPATEDKKDKDLKVLDEERRSAALVMADKLAAELKA